MTSNRKNQRGFTITEMAVVLIIFGFLTSTAMAGLRYYIGRETIENTSEALDHNKSALLAFQATYFRYPCPADPSAQPGDADYGRENCTAGLQVLGKTGRDVDGDGVGEQVLIGAIPFATLLDPDNDGNQDDAVFDVYIGRFALDGWSNKLTYAVTSALSIPGNTFNQSGGAIFIEDEGHNSMLESPGTAHYVIVSHGPNGVGAYAENGINPTINCSTGTTVPTVPPTPPTFTTFDETENCNYTSKTVARFVNGIRSNSRTKPYDDYIRYGTGTVTSLWSYTGGIPFDNNTPNDPTDDFMVFQVSSQNGGDVGIGKKSPEAKLDVAGNIQAQQIHANRICPQSGTSTLCMPVEVLAGTSPDMSCTGAGQVVVAIDENKVRCATPFSAMPAGTCPAGTVMKGVSSKTGVICQ